MTAPDTRERGQRTESDQTVTRVDAMGDGSHSRTAAVNETKSATAPLHSPLPWRVCPDDGTRNHDRTVVSGNYYVAKCHEAPGDFDDAGNEQYTGQANAEFIVRAVNSHADLLAALQDIRSRLRDVFATGEVLLCDAAPARFAEIGAVIDAAIGKAGRPREASSHVK